MAPAFWLGVFWRGATTAGAWAATLLTAMSWWLTSLSCIATSLATMPFGKSLGIVTSREDTFVVSVLWQMLTYLTVGFVGGVVVSLCTRKNEPRQLDRFYELLRTPVQENEVVLVPCTLPLGVTPPPRRVLCSNSNLEIPVPSWRAASGFLVGWLLVVGIVGSVWLLVS